MVKKTSENDVAFSVKDGETWKTRPT